MTLPSSQPALRDTGATARIRGWRDRRVLIGASVGVSLLLAVVSLLARSGFSPSGATTSAKEPTGEPAVAPERAYAIPAGVVGAFVEDRDPERGPSAPAAERDIQTPRGGAIARKQTMAARARHGRASAGVPATGPAESARTAPPLPENLTRPRVRLVDDESRVRILE